LRPAPYSITTGTGQLLEIVLNGQRIQDLVSKNRCVEGLGQHRLWRLSASSAVPAVHCVPNREVPGHRDRQRLACRCSAKVDHQARLLPPQLTPRTYWIISSKNALTVCIRGFTSPGWPHRFRRPSCLSRAARTFRSNRPNLSAAFRSSESL
jgi:hypothetical protein